MNKNKIYNIAIVGLGNIGSYLFKFLNKNRNYLSNKNNAGFRIIYVSAKNKKKKEILKLKKNNGLVIILISLKKKMLI